MTGNERFIELLEKANIEIIDVLKEGSIKEFNIKRSDMSAKLTLSFPRVIDVNLEKEIRIAFKQYFTEIMGFKSFAINLSYDDNYISSDALQIYYEYILNAVTHKKPRIGLLTGFKKEFFDNRIRFFVGNEGDKEMVESCLKDIDAYLKFYGLDVALEVEISPFEITSETKYNEKVKQSDLEIKNYESHYESLGRENPNNEKVKKQPRMKTPLSAKPVPLSSIPATEVEVIEYLNFKTLVYRLVVLLICTSLTVIGVYKAEELRNNKRNWAAVLTAFISICFACVPIYAVEDEIFVISYVYTAITIAVVMGVVKIVRDIMINKKTNKQTDETKKDK